MHITPKVTDNKGASHLFIELHKPDRVSADTNVPKMGLLEKNTYTQPDLAGLIYHLFFENDDGGLLGFRGNGNDKQVTVMINF